MRPNKILTALVVGGLAMQLVGCGQSKALNEVDSYIAAMKNQPASPIEPLPDVKSYDNFTYSAAQLRSPFAKPHYDTSAKANNGLRPDLQRKKEVLEAFSLDSLRMLGTLERKGKRWAIIKDSDGTIHRITLGNYIGQNDGKVYAISEDNIKIMEIIPDGRGGWIERKAALALVAE